MRLQRTHRWPVVVLATIVTALTGACTSLGVGVSGGGVGVGVGVEAHPPPSATVAEQQVLMDRINKHRLAIGCRALTWDGRLATVARKHSEDMARRHYFSHVDPDGRDPGERLKAAGIGYRAAAENLAEGQSDGRDVYDDWIESPDHKENLENCDFTHLGIGISGRYWTLVLVKFS
jgi:uncharacterized protein YkwD